MLENTVHTTTTGLVTFQGTAVGSYGVAIYGQFFEAKDVYGLLPPNGARVLLDYLPASSQWIIVSLIP